MPNILQGTVTKAGAVAKTITVTVRPDLSAFCGDHLADWQITRRFEHPKYLKQLERSTKMLVHDELQGKLSPLFLP